MTMTIGLCLNTHHSLRSKSTNIYQDVRPSCVSPGLSYTRTFMIELRQAIHALLSHFFSQIL